jgi:DNA-binding GntR family transcriptional regulator
MDQDRSSKIDPKRPVYVYVQVADDLEQQIKDGRLTPGAMLPGEKVLAEIYGVSYLTIRRALAEMRRRGLVITLPSKGTYVTEAPQEG